MGPNLERETALIEAILYLDTEPLDEITISRISLLSKEIVIKNLEVLKERYENQESGIELKKIGGGWVIGPKKEYWELLKDRYGKKNEYRLSKAALETLAIIAYSQPITRSEVEAIRGVSADNMMRLLFEREMIREVGKKDIPGKPIQYGTTKEFLKFFRLESIADLPKLNDNDNERFELNG